MNISITFVIALIAVAGVNSLRNKNDNFNCLKKCMRIYHPVCAKFNGIPVSFSNKCTLDGLIECANSDNEVWEFLHEGPCNSDEETREPDNENEVDVDVDVEPENVQVDEPNFAIYDNGFLEE